MAVRRGRLHAACRRGLRRRGTGRPSAVSAIMAMLTPGRARTAFSA